ncbi:hypothetical protein AGIG_G7940 [Arapaima gigas]
MCPTHMEPPSSSHSFLADQSAPSSQRYRTGAASRAESCVCRDVSEERRGRGSRGTVPSQRDLMELNTRQRLQTVEHSRRLGLWGHP